MSCDQFTRAGQIKVTSSCTPVTSGPGYTSNHWRPCSRIHTAETRRIAPGWTGATRAFSSPVSTSMIVDDVWPNGGYSWHSTLGPWRLDYDNHVAANGEGSTLHFAARLTGPASAVLERLVTPLSTLGQRRRMTRLARLAELLERHAD